MKSKRLIITLIIVIALLASVILITGNSNSTLSNREDQFAVKDTSNIVQLFLADKLNHQILLNKNKDGIWMVNDSIPAVQEKVQGFLETIMSIDVRQPVSNAMHNSVTKRLSVRHTKIEIYQKIYRINLFNKIKFFPYVKNTKTYFVGGETPDKLGTYMLIEGAKKPYVVWLPGFRGFVSTRYSPYLADWRGHQVFESKIDEIASIELVDNQNPDQSFRLENINNQYFKIFDIHNNKYLPAFDTAKAIEYLTAFRNIRFETLLHEYMKKEDIDSVLKTTPIYVFKLKRFDNKPVNIVKAYPISGEGQYNEKGEPLKYHPDKIYGSINQGNDFVLLQYYVFDKLLKPIGYFTGEEQEKFLNFKEM